MDRFHTIFAVFPKTAVTFYLLIAMVGLIARHLSWQDFHPTFTSHPISHSPPNDRNDKPRVLHTYGELPMRFETNYGQFDEKVKFVSRGSGYTLFLTPQGAVVSLKGAECAASSTKRANDQQPGTSSPRPATSSQYSAILQPSDPTIQETSGVQWHTNIANYQKVQNEELYPGIDLVFHGTQKERENDFIVGPGADPEIIQIEFDGVDIVRLDLDGNAALVATNSPKTLVLRSPVIYQEIDGERSPVEGWSLPPEANSIAFDKVEYDHTQPSIADPTLSYSSFLWSGSRAVAIDLAGHIYVTGSLDSADFPMTTGAFDASYNGGVSDVFVARLSADGSQLEYATFLGGSDKDTGSAITIDAEGNVYVSGTTASPDFPTTGDAFDDSYNGGLSDAFVVKLSADLGHLIHASFLGGGVIDRGDFIAVDLSSNIYVSGSTNSADYPTTPVASDTGSHGSQLGNVFVSKLTPDGRDLIYSTFIELNGGITIDPSGNIYFLNRSGNCDCPLDENDDESTDVVLTKLKAEGGEFEYSRCLRICESEVDAYGGDIATDAAGNIYVTGQQYYQGQAAEPVYVVKLNANGDRVYKQRLDTYGEEDQRGSAIASDAVGNAYITGEIYDVRQDELGPFVAKCDINGEIKYSSFLTGANRASQILVNQNGEVFVFGKRTSSKFLTTAGAFDTTYDSRSQAFAIKLSGLASSRFVTATLDDYLQVDNDNDGQAEPGDIVTFTAVIVNGGATDAEGVIFTCEIDPNMTILIDSVTTTLGTITEGNQLGDSSVGVDIGTIPRFGGTVTINFAVTIDEPLLPCDFNVTHQGTVSGSNFAPERTDDPDTPDLDDATSSEIIVAGSCVDRMPLAILAEKIINFNGFGAIEGDLHCNHDIESVPSDSSLIAGNLTAGRNLRIPSGYAIAGNVAAGGTATIEANASVSSRIISGATLPRVPFPSLDFGRIGGKNLMVAPSGAKLALPGDYGVVRCSTNAVMQLNSGKYDMKRLVLYPGAKLLLDLTNGPITINVLIAMQFQQDTEIRIHSATGNSRDITFNYLGTEAVLLGKNGRFQGSIYAPNARVKLARGAGLLGSIMARRVDLNKDAKVRHHEVGSTIPNVEPSPVIIATMRDTVIIDSTENVAPIYRIKYRVDLTNRGEIEASSVTFRNMPDTNTTLIAGSVTASQGTVWSGNGSSDRSIGIDCGNIASGGGTLSITYEVTINDTIDSCAATIRAQGIVSGDNFASVATDNRDEPGLEDAVAIDMVDPCRFEPFAIAARKLIKADRRVNIQGNLFSNDMIALGRFGSLVTGDLVAAGSVSAELNEIDGDVVTSGIVDVEQRFVTGAILSGVLVRALAFPALGFGPFSGPDIIIAENSDQRALPGTYDVMRCSTNAVLHLSSGVYEVNRLILRPSATLSLDLNDGPIEIKVDDKLVFRKESKIVIESGKGSSKDFILNYDGQEDVAFGTLGSFQGTVYAPRAWVRVFDNAVFVGSIRAKRVALFKYAQVRHHDFSLSLAKESLKAGAQKYSENDEIVSDFELAQNYPNPFNSTTKIKFALLEAGFVKLQIYDVLGKRVKSLVAGQTTAGHHEVIWDGRNQSGEVVKAGTYFYRMTVERENGEASKILKRKLILLN